MSLGDDMPAPYSGDLRQRVADAVPDGASARSAAGRFGISVSTAIRWVQPWRAEGSEVTVGFDLNANASPIAQASSSVVPIGRRRLAWLPVVVKRYIDISISALLLMFASPLMGLIAVLIKLDSRGHVLFRQQRLGLNRQRFDIVTFRSMRNEACADPIVTQARRGDPRVTRIGWFLRRTSLDELPQLFNVLKGDMSLVGPRPIVAEEVAKYHEHFSLYASARPGLTGLWQVSGRNATTYAQRVAYDVEYLSNWSLWRDIKIMLITVIHVINGNGAY